MFCVLSMHARSETSPCVPQNRNGNGDYVIFFAMMEKKLGEKDEDIFHRSEGNVIHRCLETWIVICYSQKIWKKKSNPFLPEITVPLNYSSFITVSAYIRTCYCKVKTFRCFYCQFRITHVHQSYSSSLGATSCVLNDSLLLYSILFMLSLWNSPLCVTNKRETRVWFLK